jgi:glucose-6-phosphate isomerase
MSSWNEFQKHYHPFDVAGIPFAIDLSRALLPENLLDEKLGPKLAAAFGAMEELEKGGIANPSEQRMVGHYWLRAPELAPEGAQEKGVSIGGTIKDAVRAVKDFAAKVHSGEIRGADGPFKNILCIGIGGSALGPQFAAAALGHPANDKLTPYFFDNTDPDGFDHVLAQLKGQLGCTLAIVTSKSGGTIETANGMKEAAAAYKAAGLDFAAHAVAVTDIADRGEKSSKLWLAAKREAFLGIFPMWDWVGGRTSELSAVGLLPAALQGLDIDGLLAGARAMDELTRSKDPAGNPAALLAAAWYEITGGKGAKDMVILPYKDRLLLFARYLQQLVMESLGKRLDLDGNEVFQGITVYGNKGATDQHAYVQQLRDGVPNFFATFIEVLKDRDGPSPGVTGSAAVFPDPAAPVAPLITSGDYLQGFFLGTRAALAAGNRPTITLTIGDVSAKSLGILIALFERAVGFYASLVNINAYDQPGVEAGKKVANLIIPLKARVLEVLYASKGRHYGVPELAAKAGELLLAGQKAGAELDEMKKILEAKEELVFKLCEHLASNADRRIVKLSEPGKPFHLATYAHL